MVSIGEQALRCQPRQPKVMAWFPNFELTLDAVTRTGMIGALPSQLVARRTKGIRALPLPFEVPLFDERCYWHPRNENDLGHRWFRRVLQCVTQDLGLTTSQSHQ